MPNQFARVPLLGLSRASSDTACKDGEMSQLINLRHKNGSLQPVYETQQVIKILGLTYDEVLIHKNAGYEHWIGYNRDGGLYWFASRVDDVLEPIKVATVITPTVLSADMIVENIEQMGNIIIVTNADGIHYFFFKDGGYVLIDDLDRFNSISLTILPRSENTSPVETSYLTNDLSYLRSHQSDGVSSILDGESVEESGRLDLTSSMLGNVSFLKKSADDYNWLYGYRYMRYAVKLYDGSYIMHSAPIIIVPKNQGELFVIDDPASFTPTLSYYLSVYKAAYKFPAFADVDNLTGIILGVDIFITKEITRGKEDFEYLLWKKINGSGEMETNGIVSSYGTDTYAGRVFRFFDKDSFIEDLKDASLYYKAESLTLAQLMAGQATYKPMAIKGAKDNLVFNEMLPDDDFTHNTLIPSVSYLYNQKLHVGDIKTRLFKGFNPDFFSKHTGGMSTYQHVRFEVILRTQDGTKSVFSDIQPYSAVGEYLLPYISYPDARAESLKIWIKLTIATIEYEMSLTFTLKAHNSLNLAYYLSPDYNEIHFNTSSPGLVINETGTSMFGAGVEQYETTPDKIKVSRVSNPFYFAAENTYSAGAQVVCMKSINEAVSEGTAFGTHPLYIFTKDGIKLLQIGNGSVYYSNMIDGPREVCANSRSALSLKNGILFASGRGLIYMSGLQTRCITEQLLSEFLDNLIAESKMQVALTNPKISTLNKYAENYSFEYSYERILNISQMAYNDREDEVLLLSANSLGDPLCYVWNVATGLWHIATYQIKNFIKCYDDLYYVRSDDASGMNIHNIKTQTKPMDALLVTRPMKIVPDVFKKLSRVYLRSQVRMGSDGVVFTDNVDVDGGRYQRLLVYGSNDAIQWFLIGGSDNNGNVRSLGVKTSSTAYKLFRFVYCGQPFQVSKFDCLEFDYIEVEYQVTMNNKLR